MVFGSCCFTCQGNQNSYGMRYIQLDIDDALLMGTLGVETLGVGVRTTSAEGSSGEGLLRDAQNTSQARARE